MLFSYSETVNVLTTTVVTHRLQGSPKGVASGRRPGVSEETH